MNLRLRTCVSLLLAMSSYSVGCRSSVRAQVPVARDGKPAAVIVTGANPSTPVRFAAQELKTYLDRMTGGSFVIVEAMPPQGASIVLGQPLAEAAGLKVLPLKRDGYLIRTIGNRIYVAGVDDNTDKAGVLFEVLKDEITMKSSRQQVQEVIAEESWDFHRGTVHGAYHLLELMGCRWFMAGPLGEVAPEQKTIDLPVLNLTEEPSWEFRVNGRVMRMHDSYVKQGYVDPEEFAALKWSACNQRLWLLRMRRSSKWMAINHRPKRHQWKERFAEDHPDYFALLEDGRRSFESGRAHLNYTSQGVFEETVKDVRAFFAGKVPSERGIKGDWHPHATYGDYFSLLPDDGLRVDRSAASLKFIHDDKPLPFRHTEYVWQFVDRVARAVEKDFPDKRLVCMAYQSYFEVPPTLKKLPDNVIVGIAALSGPSRIERAVPEPVYRDYMDLCRRWNAMNDEGLLFWSYWLYRFRRTDRQGVPLLLPNFAKRLLKDLRQFGRYMFMQHGSDALMLEQLNRYVVHRLLWNPDTDIDTLVDDYCASYFGAGAESMKEMLADMETRCHRMAALDADRIRIWEDIFPEETLKRYRTSIDRALKQTEGTPSHEHVQLMSRWFVGRMEKGRAAYVAEVKAVRESGRDLFKVARVEGKAKLDGVLNEPLWKTATRIRPFYSNRTGDKVGKVSVSVGYDDGNLYVGFECRDDNAAKLAEQPRQDFVEVWLNPDGAGQDTYQIVVRLDGAVTEVYHPDAEPADPAWRSGVRAATRVYDDKWVAEIVVPLGRKPFQGRPTEAKPWKANFCRQQFGAADRRFQATSASPLMRGSFNQPGLFGRLVFESPAQEDRR